MPEVSSFPPASGGGGSGGVQVVTVPITSAQILDLANTPVTLIPGVTGKVTNVVGVCFVYLAGATPYTLANPSSGLNIYTDVSFALWTNAAAAGFIDQASDLVSLPATAPAGGASGDPSEFAGQNIILSASFGNPTLGDGTLLVTLSYFLAPVA